MWSLPQLSRRQAPSLSRNSAGVGVQRNGCFAEYLALPAVNAFRVPKAFEVMRSGQSGKVILEWA